MEKKNKSSKNVKKKTTLKDKKVNNKKSIKKSDNYYKLLDIIRVLSCFGVLLYHLNILKGGYLAVCVFFVLSGYLSCVSLFKKDKVSLSKYYLNRLKKIYLPLCIVLFITCGVILLFKDVVFLNLKPEVYSVLLGYNNYWQINANLDYFARFVSSPFMHFWYIAILLQFELVFPFIFMLFKHIGDKYKKTSVSLFGVISLIFTSYFVYKSLTSTNFMIVYYDSLSRIFSLLFGVFLGFFNHYFKPLVFKKINSSYIFYGYILVLILSFIFVPASSYYFTVGMVFVSLISCRLIDYSLLNGEGIKNTFDKVIKKISNISYEVYLVQYPIIYILEYFNISGLLKIVITIISSFILGYLINLSCSIKIDGKDKLFKKIISYILVGVISILSAYGLVSFIISKDYSKDMKKLEEELKINEEKMALKQKEFLERKKTEKEDFDKRLKELEEDQSKLGDVVSNLSVIGVGDSVMLGAINNLYSVFPNGYFDAKKSRTDYEANGILTNLKNNGMLGEVIVFSLGTNGSGPDYLKDEINNTVEGRTTYWINVVNDRDVHVNSRLSSFADSHDNVHIIDWAGYSEGHYEYFVADGIHLTEAGREAYARCIYDAIYNDYLNELKRQVELMVKQEEEKANNRFTFFGNNLLLNTSLELEDKYNDAFFNIYEVGITFDDLIKRIDYFERVGNLTNNIIFMFDSSFNITNKDIDLIYDKLKCKNIYFVKINDFEISNKNIKVIDFYNEIKKHDNYLMVDRVHLSKDGNKALVKFINKYLEEEK